MKDKPLYPFRDTLTKKLMEALALLQAVRTPCDEDFDDIDTIDPPHDPPRYLDERTKRIPGVSVSGEFHISRKDAEGHYLFNEKEGLFDLLDWAIGIARFVKPAPTHGKTTRSAAWRTRSKRRQ